jgi:hypothetical protein
MERLEKFIETRLGYARHNPPLAHTFECQAFGAAEFHAICAYQDDNAPLEMAIIERWNNEWAPQFKALAMQRED